MLRARSAPRAWLGWLACIAAVMAMGPRVAVADPPPEGEALELGPRPHAYAIVVGANQGSEGQQPLRFAERDAERVAGTLVELSRYERGHVELLRSPSPGAVVDAIETLRPQLEAHRARGEQTVVFFFYSGHARAQSLNLGERELPLDRLRRSLTTLPATLQLVVLDACQSGAFSRVKGAEPAADFSYNSVSRLRTEGLAVMASSTGDELSQESDELGGSFFTHHLLVAMRGAGDDDDDGRVTLDEAYEYAHERTLADTSRTAVGAQHVTLETELEGHGQVPLSYPAEADTRLALPGALSGEVLVQQHGGGSVMAELVKASGQPLRLALPPGRYDVVLRQGEKIKQCDVELESGEATTLQPGRCLDAPRPSASSKGATVRQAYDPERPPRPPEPVRMETWGFEASIGMGWGRHDGYTDRLEDFRYEPSLFGGRQQFRYAFAVERGLLPYLSVVAQFERLDRRLFQRSVFDARDDRFNWKVWGLGIYLRASALVAGEWLGLYGQAGAGPAIGRTVLKTETQDGPLTDEDVHAGYHIGTAVGVQLMPWKHFGFYAQGQYTYAPAIDNRLGDEHDSGGLSVLIGLRGRMWGEQ